MNFGNYVKDPTEKRIFQRKVVNKVCQNIDAYYDNLDLRRKRLLNILTEEEWQMKDEMEHQEKLKIQFMKEKQEEEFRALEEQKNREKEESLAWKLIQLDMVKCKEIHPLIRKRRDKMLYEMHQRQIEEQQMKIREEKEEEKMWYLKMLGDAEKNKELEKFKIKEKERKEVEAREFLISQILVQKERKSKIKMKDTEDVLKVVDDFEKKLTARSETEILKRQESKSKLAEELRNQMIQNQNRKKKEREAEVDFETKISLNALSKKEDENRKRAEEIEFRRRELELFSQHAKAIKLEREAREKAEELAVAEEAKRQIEENDRRQQLEAKKSVELLKEALTGREYQLIERKKQSEEAAQLLLDEIQQRKLKEMVSKQQSLEEKQKLANEKHQYKLFLEEQIKHRKMANERNKTQTILEIKQLEDQQKQFNDRMVDLMKREFGTEKIHPFAKPTSSKVSLLPSVPETPYYKY